MMKKQTLSPCPSPSLGEGRCSLSRSREITSDLPACGLSRMASCSIRVRERVRGFSLVSAIFLLVVIAALGTFAVTLSTTQQQSAALDVMGARAYQAARAGIEWAAFGVSQTAAGAQWTGCVPTTNMGTLGGTLAPFTVAVTCTSASYTEGTHRSGSTT